MNILPINSISFRRTESKIFQDNVNKTKIYDKESGTNLILDLYGSTIETLKIKEAELAEEQKRLPKDEQKIEMLKNECEELKQSKTQLEQILKAIAEAKPGSKIPIHINILS
jgi:DNA repair exonuclease SbcCD ATPase subunit